MLAKINSLARRAWSDQPLVVDLAGLVLLAGVWVGQSKLRLSSPAVFLTTSPQVANFVPIVLALSGVAAMAAGMAGVILVFALSTNSAGFTRMRHEAGPSLKRSLVTPVVNSFLSAAAALSAALVLTTKAHNWGFWIAVWACLLLLHGVFRMSWVLIRLIDIVLGEDDRRVERDATVTSSSIVGDYTAPPENDHSSEISRLNQTRD